MPLRYRTAPLLGPFLRTAGIKTCRCQERETPEARLHFTAVFAAAASLCSRWSFFSTRVYVLFISASPPAHRAARSAFRSPRRGERLGAAAGTSSGSGTAGASLPMFLSGSVAAFVLAFRSLSLRAFDGEEQCVCGALYRRPRPFAGVCFGRFRMQGEARALIAPNEWDFHEGLVAARSPEHS